MCDPERLVSRLFRFRHAQVRAGNGPESLLHNFKATLSELGLFDAWTRGVAQSSESQWKALVRLKSEDCERRRWNREAAEKRSMTLYLVWSKINPNPSFYQRHSRTISQRSVHHGGLDGHLF